MATQATLHLTEAAFDQTLAEPGRAGGRRLLGGVVRALQGDRARSSRSWPGSTRAA